MPGEHGGRPNITLARQREQDILRLKIAGVNHREIAEVLDMTEAGVSKALKRALSKVTEQTTELTDVYRALVMARFDEMEKAIWTMAIGRSSDKDHGLAARAPSLPAIDRVLSIERERRRYLPGLEAPEKVEHTGKDGAAFVVELMVPPKGSNAPYPFDNDDATTT